MDDACPHRLAPLSEGRVDRETNRIECAYHGWSFEPSGACAKIPQATQPVATAAQAQPRACVGSYLTQVEKSVLFFWPWPEASLTAVEQEWAHPQAMLAGVATDASTYTRDLPYGWDTLLENIVDPAHSARAQHAPAPTPSQCCHTACGAAAARPAARLAAMSYAMRPSPQPPCSPTLCVWGGRAFYPSIHVARARQSPLRITACRASARTPSQST